MWTDRKREMGSNFLYVLAFADLKFCSGGLVHWTSRADARTTHCCPPGSEPPSWPWVQPAPCAAHSTPAPGSPRDRAHSLHKCQEATVPHQCRRPAPWQSSFPPTPCCYGMNRNSFTAAEPIPLKDRDSSQMTQDIVLRQTRSNFPMFSFKRRPFNKQSGFFQRLKSHGLNICMQLLQHQLFQLCLSSAAALSKHC